ncbi:Squalene-hopene cyclase C-terminal domain-containing protein [Flavobacterium resistens]|uniref:Squalene-hopene cyclase C-terminal domain-containing protein n=1 Tax=Flavobacterium resistens TaxID=443612 RepID=A0A521EZ89_9FLAO|nr:prenyltransferase/squalene oxidase repeat-containing protein [Flavobacterium resistens]MRX69330.1 hypothetical protein [Flavobacterium resistens]SMO89268.1 Squalene-hopene cyclase C-terminal domain-containing protein [Flavobacterium resistens]
MKINNPVHQENFISYIKELPFDKETISIILKASELGNNPSFYLEYASLFQNSFTIKDQEAKVKLLNIAGYLCYIYSLLLDASLDKDTKHNNLLLSGIFLEESIKLLTSLFGLNKSFWSCWNLRKKDVFKASKIGKELFHQSEVSLAEYEKLCDAKSALGKIALDALFILSDNTEKTNYEKLMESHKYFSIGFQISDDIEDFIEDYANKEFNFAVYIFLNKNGKNFTDIKELKKIFYISNTASDLYNLALSYYEKALITAKDAGENTWLEAISGKIRETKSAISSINEYLTIIKTKTSIKENSIKINSFEYEFNKNSIIELGLNYLIKEWEKDYPEVKHIMVLSNYEGFKNDKDLHITDIFQRGIITNNLIDIHSNYKIDLSMVISNEINYLFKNRNNDEVGCWSYFPSVKEIAPDADDLGQMMQVFIKNNKKNIVDDYCINGIKILLDDCYNEKTGGIETWIIPKENQTEKQKTQKKFNDTKWGSGPDIDVMANFLYALSICSYEKYKSVIENGTDYIFSKIENDSFWNSRWYYGWQYGTMLCVRLGFEVLRNNPDLNDKYLPILLKTRDYITKSQQKNGGWAMSSAGHPDPLSTALALSTLMLYEKLENNQITLSKGIAFLENTQQQDGSWEAVPFIKPKLNEPYKSKVISSSYVLNTLTTYNNF